MRTERELLAAFHHDGDREARREVIERSMTIVAYVARRYAGRGIDDDELEQVGAIGLIKAVDRYDLDRQVQFVTFAIPNISGEIRRHFRDKGWGMRVPRGVQEHGARIQVLGDELTARLSRAPTVPELATATALSVEQVLDALEGARQYTLGSLDAPADGHDDAVTGFVPVGRLDPGYARVDALAVLEQCLGGLEQRERQIIALRFFQGLTQTEIAGRMGMSQMHVSRLLTQSLDLMRDQLERDEDAKPRLTAVA